MRLNARMLAAAAAGFAAAAGAQEMVEVKIQYPRPSFESAPDEIKGALNLEPPRGGKPYDPIRVPAGCEKPISLNCKVTSSDPSPARGELSFITDGDKERDSYVTLAPGLQWVQVDLGKTCVVYGICLWHRFGGAPPRVYLDMVCQISDDPDFFEGVVTVFNNDHDDSAKLGAGKDFEYIETFTGRPIPVDAVKGRYVRFYSRGNTREEVNHYTEIEVYGKGE